MVTTQLPTVAVGIVGSRPAEHPGLDPIYGTRVISAGKALSWVVAQFESGRSPLMQTGLGWARWARSCRKRSRENPLSPFLRGGLG